MRYMTMILLLNLFITVAHANNKPNDFVVGKFGLHFDNLGDIIKPDEYYFFEAIENAQDGYNESALKNFRKAASYGNTFGAYYSGLLYLQKNDQIKGHAWLSMANADKFTFADKVNDLLVKLEHQMKQKDLRKAEEFYVALNEVYGVEAALKRRLKWSRNFKITGSNIGGKVTNFTKVITDLSRESGGFISFDKPSKSNAFIDVISMKRQFNSFVYDYKSDFRLTDGEVKMDDVELIEDDKK